LKYKAIREEELKNKVGGDWFSAFDTTEIVGNIDFCVLPKQDSLFGRLPLLWAEAKTGNYDVTTMFVQLILTIGKARTFDKTLPPAFLGAFDFKKITFVPYVSIQDIFYLNDFDWTVTPSNQSTKEFALIKNRIEATSLTVDPITPVHHSLRIRMYATWMGIDFLCKAQRTIGACKSSWTKARLPNRFSSQFQHLEQSIGRIDW